MRASPPTSHKQDQVLCLLVDFPTKNKNKIKLPIQECGNKLLTQMCRSYLKSGHTSIQSGNQDRIKKLPRVFAFEVVVT